MQSSTILLIDSGIGGLSVATEIKQRIGNTHIHYVADNQYYPYGRLTADQLVKRCIEITQDMTSLYSYDLIVIACNTASTVVLPFLRELYSIPIVGVVPAIKPAAALSLTKTIGLLATEGTVNRNYTDQLAKDFAADCQLFKLACPTLVEMAESKIQGNEVDRQKLEEILRPLLDTDALDTIILGCTHFPFLLPELKKINPSIQWLDSGKAVATRCATLLEQQKITEHDTNTINDLLFYTQTKKLSDQEHRWYTEFGFNEVKFLDQL